MPNILVRDLSQQAVDRVDAAAAELGFERLSRNEYLRRWFEHGVSPVPESTVTSADWKRSAETFADLADPGVMESAWR